MSYRDNYKLIDWNAKEIALPQRDRSAPARSDLPVPMVISDSMPECEHVDGKFYSSKSAFRRVTKANGLVEVGNDPARHSRKRTKQDRDKAISESVDRAFARVTA